MQVRCNSVRFNKLRAHNGGLGWGISEINLKIKHTYTYLNHRQCLPGIGNLNSSQVSGDSSIIHFS